MESIIRAQRSELKKNMLGVDSRECCIHENKPSPVPKIAKRGWDMIQTTSIHSMSLPSPWPWRKKGWARNWDLKRRGKKGGCQKGEWFLSGETNHFHAKDSQKVVGYDTDHSCSKHGSAFTLAIAKNRRLMGEGKRGREKGGMDSCFYEEEPAPMLCVGYWV